MTSFLFRGAGNLYDLLDHVVEQLGGLRVGSAVVDLLALPAADDEAAGFQLPQMMGDGGAGHIHHGGEVGHALLAVAEKPENPNAAAVAHLFENIGNHLKVLHAGHVVKLVLEGLIVVVG